MSFLYALENQGYQKTIIYFSVTVKPIKGGSNGIMISFGCCILGILQCLQTRICRQHSTTDSLGSSSFAVWRLIVWRLYRNCLRLPPETRMHSSRMRTARSLTVSHRKKHAPLPQEQPCTPPGATTHAPPGATTHAPGATTHTPL